MAIESHGYDTTIKPLDWALVSLFAGRPPCRMATDHWQPSVGVGPLQVNLSPGIIAGDGIVDISDAVQTLTVPQSTSGSKWHTIGVMRDYVGKRTSLFVQQGGAAELMTLPTSTNTNVRYSPVALVRVDAGKTQVGAVKSLLPTGQMPLWGAMSGIRDVDKRDGQRITDPDTMAEYVYKSGQLTPLNRPPQMWTGTSSSWASGFTMDVSKTLVPYWVASTRHGVATFTPEISGQRIYLNAGWYEVSAMIPVAPDFGNLRFDLRVNCTGLGPTLPKAADIGGASMGVIPNGASKTIRIQSDRTPLTLLANSTFNTTASSSLYLTGNYLDIIRLGDI